MRPALLIDSSTIDPPTARELDAAVAASSLHHDARPCSDCSAAHPSLIDAPVSGGITGAAKATLTFMVSALLPGTKSSVVELHLHVQLLRHFRDAEPMCISAVASVLCCLPSCVTL